MNRFFTYTAAALLTVTYLLSYIGFGIHTCTCNGTREVILLFNNLSCDTIHAHIHLAGHEHHHGDGADDDCTEPAIAGHECTHRHHDGCCHTDIMVITDAQDDSRQTNLVQVSFRTIGSSATMPAFLRSPAPTGLQNNPPAASGPDIPDIGAPTLEALSVRRI